MDPLTAYARIWLLQQLEQAILNGPGYALKGQPLLAIAYLINLILAIRAARTGSLHRILVAHAMVVVLYLWRLPYMWDEDHWAVRTDLVVLVAALAVSRTAKAGAELRAAVLAEACAIVPLIMALFYSGSAMWKANEHFFDPRGSCGTMYLTTDLRLLVGESVLLGTRAGQALLAFVAASAPALTLVVELSIAACLLAPPQTTLRRCGVFLAMLLHLMISLTPAPLNVTEYSIVCLVRLFFLVPHATAAALQDAYEMRASAKLACAAVAAASGALNLNPLGVVGTPIYVALFMLFARALYLDASTVPASSRSAAPLPAGTTYKKWHVAESIAFCYGLLALGLADQGPSKPFANIRSSHGANNHYFLPLGVLPRRLKDHPPSLGLGGGVYRVDDCNATVVNEVFPGELRLHSEADVRVMRAAGHTARLFSPAFAVIIAPFLATPNAPGPSFVKYTLPARELRRLLHNARAANDPFYLEYSHLPDYTGDGSGVGSGHAAVPSRVRVALDGRGKWTCTVLRRISWLPVGETAAECEPGELALLGPPPLWVRKLTLAWPYPVLEGEPEGQRGFCHGE